MPSTTTSAPARRTSSSLSNRNRPVPVVLVARSSLADTATDMPDSGTP